MPNCIRVQAATRSAFLTFIVMLPLLIGCTGNSEPEVKSKSETAAAQQGPDSAEIIRQTIRTYREAQSYQDEATFQISYQLLGKHLEEPHPWSLSFSRGQGLKADIFETRIRADDERLACFVFDFASGNLDDQWQVHDRTPALPLNPLFQDGICRHYLTGHADVPIKANNTLAADIFFPPTLALLTQQVDLKWMANGESQRLADENVQGFACFQLKLKYRDLNWLVFVDQENYLIRKIIYPNQLLDSQLENNPDVRHLEVVATFNKAKINPDFPTSDFDLEVPVDAKTVRNFVPVPEAFPSSYLGEKIKPIGLRDLQDQPSDPSQWLGKVTLLCWTNQALHEQKLVETLRQVKETLPEQEFQIRRVEIVEGTLPGNQAVANHLRQLEETEGVPVFADYAFSAGRALGLHHYPMLAVINDQGVLQYVQSLEDDTIRPEMLTNILRRVHSGDDIAGEMRQEYAAFLDLYRERLAAARVGDASKTTQLASTQSRPTHLSVSQKWSNSDFQQPGNLRRQNEEFTLLDGWRTVIQLDSMGREKSRKELDLDPQESISIVRMGDKQKQMSVVYSVMGRTVRVLDQNLTPIKIVEVNNDQQHIRDANLFDFDNDGTDELLVSFTGPRGTEIIDTTEDSQSRRISNQSFRSATVLQRADNQRTLVFCDANANLRFIDSGNNQAKTISCDLVATTRVVAESIPGEILLCAIGTDAQGQWLAVGLNQDLQQVWSVPIGNQRFETQIDPVTFAYDGAQGKGFWVIASAEQSLKLISTDGKLVDDWRIGEELRGVELTTSPNGFLLIFSTDQDVQAWNIAALNNSPDAVSADQAADPVNR